MDLPTDHDRFRSEVYGKADRVARVLGISARRAELALVELCEMSLESLELAQVSARACDMLTRDEKLGVEEVAELLRLLSRHSTLRRRLRRARRVVELVFGRVEEDVARDLRVSVSDLMARVWELRESQAGETHQTHVDGP